MFFPDLRRPLEVPTNNTSISLATARVLLWPDVRRLHAREIATAVRFEFCAVTKSPAHTLDLCGVRKVVSADFLDIFRPSDVQLKSIGQFFRQLVCVINFQKGKISQQSHVRINT
ncbi:hypothetical protein WG74_09140 [Citromicrobium sp. JL477]|nr:hypothetical protein WG74_09140 [Citromicrobium sp. JL477]